MAVRFLCLCVIATVVSHSSSMTSSKAVEGYPSGYLSDCPEMDTYLIMSKEALEFLAFYVHGPGSFAKAKMNRYNYFEMKKLAIDPNMDFRKKTVVYVGGFMDSPNLPFARTIAPAYKNLGYNVLLLDTNYFTTVPYPIAAVYMKTVGEYTAEMLANLTAFGLDPKRLEFVGLSLGAQTVSFIAKNYYLITSIKVYRITGLDPAGPCFRNLGPENRLNQSDADFVDTINTNIDGFGMATPMGHVNIYVNGGEFQPGDVIFMPCNFFCSHMRSFNIWIAALRNPDSFIAMQCSSVQEARLKSCYDKVPQITNLMGLKCDKTKEGIFFLETANNYPYYLGAKGLKRENESFLSFFKSILDTSSMEN